MGKKIVKLKKNFTLGDVALVMSSQDNVAVAKTEILKGYSLLYSGTLITIKNTVPAGHRFALCDILKGEKVKQYSYPFGISKGISMGSKVDRSNVSEIRIDYKKLSKSYIVPRMHTSLNKTDKAFFGYKRKNGEVGTRNYYVIIPTSLCASDIAKRIADDLDRDNKLKVAYPNIDGIVAAAHTEGCGSSDGVMIDRLLLTLKNTILNPNVCGALIIDLGCEKISASSFIKYAGDLSKYGKTIDTLSIQESGGTRKAVEKGKYFILKSLRKCSQKREQVSIKHLVIGTECGASDSFSGITANPLIGSTVDKIINSGGSAILSEAPEMIGAEEALIKRMISKSIAMKFVKGMSWYKDLADKLDISMEGNFVPGNKKGGLVNLTLKSLGAVLKGGTTAIVDFMDYAERISRKGLSIMNGPGNDLESMTGIAASGANIFLFSTGRGATEGNLIVPVIKISSTTELYKKLNEDIDFNAGKMIDENSTIDNLGDKLLDFVIAVASGKKTWADKWKKRSYQVWTAGKLSL